MDVSSFKERKSNLSWEFFLKKKKKSETWFVKKNQIYFYVKERIRFC